MTSPRLFNTNKRVSGGFSLIEILVVIAILSVVLGIGSIYGFSAIPQSGIISERDSLAAFLISTRGKALANVDEEPHGLRITPDSFIIFEGDTFNASDPDNQTIDRTSEVTIEDDSSNTTFDVIFKQLSGDVADGDGNITLSQDGAEDQAIAINAFGGIDW